ncbi:hypothetical protein F5Y17DRAFT_396813 [Xylariaceae sp. FL0594]|nr:hypothetical protein F5Y17DRAFT_396813 [Xylariaceae sp. FL0594]
MTPTIAPRLALTLANAQAKGLAHSASSASGSAAALKSLTLRICTRPPAVRRTFATSSALSRAPNQVFDSVRRPSDLHTYTRLASTSGVPLLTLWTTSYCPSCATVAPLIRTLVQDERVGEAEGGVAFVTVEMDAPDIMSDTSNIYGTSGNVGGLGGTFMITSVPTLLSFNDAGDPVTRTKVVDVRKLSDREFLVDWIRREARESGTPGTGGGGIGGILGGLFRGWR